MNEKGHKFECPNEGCSKIFKTAKYLDEHVTIGNYSSKLRVTDKAKGFYSERLPAAYPSRKVNITNTENSKDSNSTRSLEMRWALKAKTVQAKFAEKQKAYMLEKYSLGQVTGKT